MNKLLLGALLVLTLGMSARDAFAQGKKSGTDKTSGATTTGGTTDTGTTNAGTTGDSGTTGTPGSGTIVTYYVRLVGSDTNPGTSPDQALRTIQAALSKCTGTTGGYQIIVGPGKYVEHVRLTTTASPRPGSGSSSTPNLLYGDSAGAYTGEAGGSVSISGNGTQLFGIEVNGVSNWNIRGFTLSDQSTAGIYLTGCSGISVSDCTVHLGASTVGIHSDAYNTTIEQNTIFLSGTTGHGIFQRCLNQGYYIIKSNRVMMPGTTCMTSAFRSTPSMATSYGIYANSENPDAAQLLLIENNIISDRQTGCYVSISTDNPLTSVNVSSNTVVACTYPLHISVYGTILATAMNNLAGYSYYGGHVDLPLGSIRGFMNFQTVVGATTIALVKTGIVTVADPMFVSPSTGNFALAAGSPAIDAGSWLGAPFFDIRGRARPADGNHDTIPVHDLGALEYSAPAQYRIAGWYQKDHRSVPRYKLPTIAPLKVGSVLIP